MYLALINLSICGTPYPVKSDDLQYTSNLELLFKFKIHIQDTLLSLEIQIHLHYNITIKPVTNILGIQKWNITACMKNTECPAYRNPHIYTLCMQTSDRHICGCDRDKWSYRDESLAQLTVGGGLQTQQFWLHVGIQHVCDNEWFYL